MLQNEQPFTEMEWEEEDHLNRPQLWKLQGFPHLNTNTVKTYSIKSMCKGKFTRKCHRTIGTLILFECDSWKYSCKVPFFTWVFTLASYLRLFIQYWKPLMNACCAFGNRCWFQLHFQSHLLWVNKYKLPPSSSNLSNIEPPIEVVVSRVAKVYM